MTKKKKKATVKAKTKPRTKTTTKGNKTKAVCPDPIRAVITKSQMYDDLLTIKIWDDRKGRLTAPRQAITDAGYKEGDDVLIVPASGLVIPESWLK